MLRLPLFVALFFLPFGASHAQTPRLESITIEQGLSQGFVRSICQDSDGFLWFGTSNGLNRYDGYEFLSFKNDPFDPYSISGDEIISLGDAGDYISLLSNGGFNLYHRRTRRFYCLWPKKVIQGAMYSNIVQEGKNAAWLFVLKGPKHNLYRISWPEDFEAQINAGKTLESLVRIDTVIQQSFIADMAISADYATLWVISDGSLLRRDNRSGALSRIALPKHYSDEFVRLFADPRQGVWITQPGQLSFFDGQNWQTFPVELPDCRGQHLNALTGVLWIRSGPDVYGFDTRRMPAVLRSQTAVHHLSIPEIAICSWTDCFGIVWFGTDAQGIRKFNPRSSVFKNYLEGYSVYSPLVADGQGKVWLGDIRRGAMPAGVLDLTSGKLQGLPALGVATDTKSNLIALDAQGNCWRAPMGGFLPPVLVQSDVATGTTTNFPIPPEFQTGKAAMRFRAPDQLWLSNAGQLLRFDIPSHTFSLFSRDAMAGENPVAYDLVQTPDGSWWIATETGLLKATAEGDPRTTASFQFTLLQNRPDDRKSLPCNQIKCLLPDPREPNKLWIGTSNQGICKLDLRDLSYVQYTTRNGLPDNTVYGIVAEEPDGGQAPVLWLSTNKGLTRFNTATEHFQYFFKSDGLQDNEFNTYAYGRGPDGRLLFGGVNGLTAFYPKDLNTNMQAPQVYISGLRINGRQLDPRDSLSPLATSVEYAQSIELPFDRNNLVLQFFVDDYTRPERNQFAYYLEGAEPEWAHRGFEHSAQYLNLAPGTYTFRVKGANSDGVWNETPATLRIVIHPPWYRSWWAYSLYFLLAASAAYLFYKIQINRNLEHAETERLEDWTPSNPVFTNISHEFRTPLTVILGMAQRLEESGSGSGAGMTATATATALIRRSGENLLRLVNQILDLAELENHSLQLQYVQGDVAAYVRYVAESLHSLANAKNILLRVESNPVEIVMDYDPDRLLQIVHNLLSNAIKFTPSGGQVRMQLTVEDTRSSAPETLMIKVLDTGAGIAAEDLPKVFDRFYQADNQEHAKAGGTGIGLSLTRELVKAMGGEISVDSQTGQGSAFTVTLPITNQAPPDLQKKIVQPPAAAFPSTPSTLLREPSTLPQILLIEDNADVVEYLSVCLGEYYQLDYAYNGRAGIEKALETVPDLIISDVMMPEKDGFEVCDTLKNDERSSHIPIVLLTAKAGVEDRIAGLRRGADAYLAKPFHPEELLVTLSKLIELRQKLRARYAGLEHVPPTEDHAVQIEDAFLQKIRTAVESRLSDASLSADELCRLVGMSHSVVHRKLTALTGLSLTLYVRSVRLKKACELLASTADSVGEIAFATGFNDPKFFSRVFSEQYGMPPSTYRQQQQ